VTASLQALACLAEAFNRLQIKYFVGGSLATSLHGVMRSTQDIDLIIEVAPYDVDRLSVELGANFEIDIESFREAAKTHRSCNIFFLPEFTRIDIYVPENSSFNFSRMNRRQSVRIPGVATDIFVASPEDAVLKKLEWFRKGEEISRRHWDDVLSLAKLHANALDRPYLEEWAAMLGVSNLIQRLFQEIATSKS
jgi:hypothetical protein